MRDKTAETKTTVVLCSSLSLLLSMPQAWATPGGGPPKATPGCAEANAAIENATEHLTANAKRMVNAETDGAALSSGERSFVNDLHTPLPADPRQAPNMRDYRFDIERYRTSYWPNYNLLNSYTIEIEEAGKIVSRPATRIRDEVITQDGRRFLLVDIDNGSGRFVPTRVPAENVKAIHFGDTTHLENARITRKYYQGSDPDFRKFRIRGGRGRSKEVTLTFRPYQPGDPDGLAHIPHGHIITVREPRLGNLVTGRFRGVSVETGEILLEDGLTNRPITLPSKIFVISPMGHRQFVLGRVTDERYFEAAESNVKVLVSHHGSPNTWVETRVRLDTTGDILFDGANKLTTGRLANVNPNIVPSIPCDPKKIADLKGLKSSGSSIPIYYKAGPYWVDDEIVNITTRGVHFKSHPTKPISRSEFLKMELRTKNIGVNINGEFNEIHGLNLGSPLDRRTLIALREDYTLAKEIDRDEVLRLLDRYWPQKDAKDALLAVLYHEGHESRIAVLNLLKTRLKADTEARHALAEFLRTDKSYFRTHAIEPLAEYVDSDPVVRSAFLHILERESADSAYVALSLKPSEVISAFQRSGDGAKVHSFLQKVSVYGGRPTVPVRLLDQGNEAKNRKIVDILKPFFDESLAIPAERKALAADIFDPISGGKNIESLFLTEIRTPDSKFRPRIIDSLTAEQIRSQKTVKQAVLDVLSSKGEDIAIRIKIIEKARSNPELVNDEQIKRALESIIQKEHGLPAAQAAAHALGI